MRKNVFGRQFKRDINERKALFKGLMTSLVMHETITTTEEKAKAIRGQVERLVTKAKRRKNEARAFLQPYVSAEAVEKILINLAPRFADRPGGYTRIIKLNKRFSDNASMALIEWVDKPIQAEIITPQKSSSKSAKISEGQIEATIETKTTKKTKKEEVKSKTKENKKK